MCKFKLRLLIAFLTFGIGVLTLVLWKNLPATQKPNDAYSVTAPQEAEQPVETTTEKTSETDNSIDRDVNQRSFLNCSDEKARISYKNISFLCNPALGSEIEVTKYSAVPLDSEEDKSGYEHPAYTSFKFVNTDQKDTDYDARISVYPVKEYRRMYAISRDSTKRFDDEIKLRKTVVYGKTGQLKHLESFLGAVDGQFRFKSQINYIRFKNGMGVGFVTQSMNEDAIISNQQLIWAFEGLTTDGKYFIRVTFPVSASFLPYDRNTNEFENFSLQYDYWNHQKDYEQYMSTITERLNTLPPDQYQPNLDYVSQIVSSLEAR